MSKSKRLALVTSFPSYTGMGKCTFNLFKKLSAPDWKAEVLYFGDDLDCPGEKIKQFPQKFKTPFYNNIFRDLYYYSAVPAGYDLYHLASQYQGKILKNRAQLNKPMILTHYDSAPWVMPQAYNRLNHWYWRQSVKHYKQADRIIVMTEQVKEELLRWDLAWEKQIRVTPLCYDEQVYFSQDKIVCRQKLGISPEAKVVMYVGREQAARKNVITLLKVLQKLKNEIPNLCLLKIGNIDPQNASLKTGLQLKEVYGIPEAEMPIHYGAADILVFPSYYEGGYAYPPLEAMACGTPVITSPELKLYEQGCLIVGADDQTALAAEITRLFSDKVLYQSWVDKGYKLVAAYPLAKQVAATLQVYTELSN